MVNGVQRFDESTADRAAEVGRQPHIQEIGRIDLAWGTPGRDLVEDDVETVEVLNEEWDTWKQA